nr:unnamed protein product [Callosobruchus analis]
MENELNKVTCPLSLIISTLKHKPSSRLTISQRKTTHLFTTAPKYKAFWKMNKWEFKCSKSFIIRCVIYFFIIHLPDRFDKSIELDWFYGGH